MTIVGEPGVGKTTLVRELWELLVGRGPAPVRRTGRCLPYGDGITYWPLGEVLKEHFGLLEGDARRGRPARTSRGARSSASRSASRSRPGSTRSTRASACTRRPSASWRRSRRERPAVVLVRGRPLGGGRLPRPARAHRPRGARAGRRARDRTPGALDPPPDLGRRAAEHDDDLARAARGGGRVAPRRRTARSRAPGRRCGSSSSSAPRGTRSSSRSSSASSWTQACSSGTGTAGRSRDVPEGFSVPDSVQAVIAARLDRLPPLEKSALQAAAVVGRAFWPRSVIHARRGRADFDLLEERDFVRRRGGSSLAGEREYAIKHALTREVAYASIPKARRGRLHATLARLARSRSTSRGARRARRLPLRRGGAAGGRRSRVGRRSRRASRGDGREAVRWLRRAGGLARGRYEMEEAIDLFTRAARALRRRARALAPAGARSGRRRRSATTARACGRRAARVARGAARRRTSGRTPTRPRVPGVDSVGDVVDPPEPPAHRGVGGPAARRSRRTGSDAQVRAILAPRERRALGGWRTACSRRRPRSPRRSAASSSRSYAFGARARRGVRAPAVRRSSDWAERRLELLPGIDDPDHLCEAYESASRRSRPWVASGGAAARGAPRGVSAPALGAPSRALGLSRARARRTRSATGRPRGGDGSRPRDAFARTSRPRACGTRATSSCARSRTSASATRRGPRSWSATPSGSLERGTRRT